jgi:class 3 adenylate cyclase
MDVADWLRRLGLERYEATFRENRIDTDLLPKLTVEDLKDLGITLVGDRRRLLEAIAALRDRNGETEPAAPPAAKLSLATMDAERRQITVLFCDIVDSTALSTRLDPEDLRSIITAFQRKVAETAAFFSGFVAQYMGDARCSTSAIRARRRPTPSGPYGPVWRWRKRPERSRRRARQSGYALGSRPGW